MYDKVAGMTGTAATEEEEFKEIYGLEVVVIPTHKPMIREDYPDVIYRTKREKYTAVADEVEETFQKGQPVLIGTTSIESSERLSKILKARKIPHNVLNAKHHEREAQIVAQAGRLQAVTVATNMAGRGTDIVLGGHPESLAREEAAKHDIDPTRNPEEFVKILDKKKAACELEHEKVVELGGLKIIGTERHESRRIDNQLRGRSGRQGDPGCSRFYLSLEDDLLRLFGSDKIEGLMGKLGMEEGESIEHGLLSRAIESAQKRVEQYHFDIRRQLLMYDNVMNQQREAVYEERRKILTEADVLEYARQIVDDAVAGILEGCFPEGGEPQIEAAMVAIKSTFRPGDEKVLEEVQSPEDLEPAAESLRNMLRERLDAKFVEMGNETANALARFVILHVLDSAWKEHLLAMDELRRGIGLRAIGQKDPLLEYQFESYNLFQEMMSRVRRTVAEYLFRVSVVNDTAKTERSRRLVNSRESAPIDGVLQKKGGADAPSAAPGQGKPQPVRKGRKIGRNDPCPCGSGKKYKHCCGKNQ
jgi:preprotein translocase subunit SecA